MTRKSKLTNPRLTELTAAEEIYTAPRTNNLLERTSQARQYTPLMIATTPWLINIYKRNGMVQLPKNRTVLLDSLKRVLGCEKAMTLVDEHERLDRVLRIAGRRLELIGDGEISYSAIQRTIQGIPGVDKVRCPLHRLGVEFGFPTENMDNYIKVLALIETCTGVAKKYVHHVTDPVNHLYVHAFLSVCANLEGVGLQTLVALLRSKKFEVGHETNEQHETRYAITTRVGKLVIGTPINLGEHKDV